MSGVRVLVGTRKGAFILSSDGKREKWDVSGPHFAGWEIYHMKGSQADPNRIYVSQTSGWFGQVIQRSDDGGRTWHQPGTPKDEPTTGPGGTPKGESNKFVYDTSSETGAPMTTHQFYDGKPHPWEFKRVWHLEPSLSDPDTVYAGVEDAAIFKTTNGGKDWKELSGLRGHGTGPKWQPGAGGMCLHSIILDPKDPNRIWIAISAAGAFRTDDGGKTWKDAELQQAGFTKAFTRFRMPWDWDGGAASLQSRATDETGYLQPSGDEMLAARGRNYSYHNNQIKVWYVRADGSVSHVAQGV